MAVLSGERHESKREWDRRASLKKRDIGPPPDIADYEMRLLVQDDAEAFLRILFPALFTWQFSPLQRKSIQRMQDIATHGGMCCQAEPRGSGKTQRALRLALWAILTGRRQYVPVIGATAKAAVKIIKTVKQILRHNELLYALFPAEVHGFPQLENHNRAAAGQLCQGQETGINLGADTIVFPRIPGSDASGCVFWSGGLTGNIRGQFHTTMDGRVIRPDYVILDDPQTKESAKSIHPGGQTEDRLETIHQDVLGLAGPGKRISCTALCTVINKNDLSERLLADPRWHGTRAKTINRWPDDMGAWDRYFERVREYERTRQFDRINEDYLENQEALDAGCEVEWSEKVDEARLSAIQSAMHVWHDMGPRAFGAEYQNEPLEEAASIDQPTFGGLSTKLTNLPPGVVPSWATKITYGVDVQQRVLFYLVAAWADDFRGTVIDYGTLPKQPRSYFAASEVHPSLQTESGASQVEGAVHWGVTTMLNVIGHARYRGQSDGDFPVNFGLMDANWGEQTETVYQAIATSPYRALVLPSHGKGLKAGDKPMTQWKKKHASDQIGLHWTKTLGDKRRLHALYDANFWKTFLAHRVMAAAGEKGSLGLCGDKPEPHRLFFDHLGAETPTKTFGQERHLWEWRLTPGAENHWLDCLVMSAVAASMLGVSIEQLPAQANGGRRKFSLPGK